jgi:hypothetical protein
MERAAATAWLPQSAAAVASGRDMIGVQAGESLLQQSSRIHSISLAVAVTRAEPPRTRSSLVCKHRCDVRWRLLRSVLLSSERPSASADGAMARL